MVPSSGRASSDPRHRRSRHGEGRLFQRHPAIGVGAGTIAKHAGIKVPPETKVLIAEVKGVGPDVPFSCEKLSPTLALYKADTYEDAIENAKALLRYGGLGHTAVAKISAGIP